MKYFVTEKTEIGSIRHEFPTARDALSFVDNIDLAESKLTIRDENGEKLDRLDLKIRAEHEGS